MLIYMPLTGVYIHSYICTEICQEVDLTPILPVALCIHGRFSYDTVVKM